MYTEIARIFLDKDDPEEAEKIIGTGIKYHIGAFTEQMIRLSPKDLPIAAAVMQEMAKLSEKRLRTEDKEVFEMAVKAAAEALAPMYKDADTRWAIIISPEGDWEPTPCNGDGGLEMKELQRMVDGDIEIIGTSVYSDIDEGDGVMMIINEEGKLRDLPLNQEATKIARIFEYDAIRGNAVLMVSCGEELKGFSEAAVKEITGKWAPKKSKAIEK